MVDLGEHALPQTIRQSREDARWHSVTLFTHTQGIQAGPGPTMQCVIECSKTGQDGKVRRWSTYESQMSTYVMKQSFHFQPLECQTCWLQTCQTFMCELGHAHTHMYTKMMIMAR